MQVQKESIPDSASVRAKKVQRRVISDRKSPGGLLGLIFAGYVPLASQSPYPIIVYSVANYRPHLSHFWANM